MSIHQGVSCRVFAELASMSHGRSWRSILNHEHASAEHSPSVSSIHHGIAMEHDGTCIFLSDISSSFESSILLRHSQFRPASSSLGFPHVSAKFLPVAFPGREDVLNGLIAQQELSASAAKALHAWRDLLQASLSYSRLPGHLFCSHFFKKRRDMSCNTSLSQNWVVM